MSKVSKIVLVTAAATGLSFSPVMACTYMKSAEHKKPMISAKSEVGEVKMSTSDAPVILPTTAESVEATPTVDTDKPALAE